MADEFVKGLNELMTELKKLPGNVSQNGLRTGIFRAAQFMRDRVKETAPVSSGNPPKGRAIREKYPPGTLRKTLKAKRRRGSKTEVAAGVTGVFYAKFVEFGHVLKSHGRKKDQREVIGHVPANPFIARAFEGNKEKAIEEMKKGIVESIQKQLAKRRAKIG
jgi:HK97 gp10 family phage protein